MKDLRTHIAPLALGATLLAGCSDGPIDPGTLPFGAIGEARLELVTPLYGGAGELEQTLTWSSDGPWELSERISYDGDIGDENATSSILDPEGLAGRYFTWILQLHSPAIHPFDLEALPDAPCNAVPTRLTLTVTDVTRDSTRTWTRCVNGTLGRIEEVGAEGDAFAARVALAAKLMRDNAFVEEEFVSSFEPSYPFATLERGDHTPVAPQTPRAILTPEAWRNFWIQHTGSPAGLPPVDFGKDLVLVGLHPAGPRREAGDSIEIRKVLPVGEGTVVQMTLRRPGAFCSPAQRVHVPYHIVVTPRAGAPAPITFQMPVDEEHVPCG